jgi:hypothetical protein
MAENLPSSSPLQKIDDTSLRDWFAKDPQGALADHAQGRLARGRPRKIVLADDRPPTSAAATTPLFHGTAAAAHAAAHHEG